MSDELEKSNALKLVFILIGLVMMSVGFYSLFGNWLNRIGYLMLGFGIVFIGYSFSPDYFLAKMGKTKIEMTKPARIISLVGFLVVFIGGLLEYM
jgi:hypothetical protein